MSFRISNSSSNGFDKIILSDDTGTSVEIIPACGAILHAFNINHNNEKRNIIEHYESLEDFKSNVASKGFRSCKLSPFACRIRNGEYSFGQTNHKIQKYYDGTHALHGLLYDAVFVIMDQNEDAEKATVTMRHSYEATDPGYPFFYDCIVTYELRKNNALYIETTIINKTDGLIPVQDGWHPYFNLGGRIDAWQLEFQAKTKLESTPDLIPTGKALHYEMFNSLRSIEDTCFDDCFLLNFAECQPLCVLRNPLEKIQLEIYPSASYPYLQLYTPPDRKSIALENLSAAPDAFNNDKGLITLAAGETASFKTTYIVSTY